MSFLFNEVSMKYAAVYHRDHFFFLHSEAVTIVGLQIASEPSFKVELNDNEELKNALLACLDGSISEVPHPKDFSNLFEPISKLSGKKSWGAFAKGARLVEVRQDANGEITLTPMRNLGPKEGFVPIADREILIGDKDISLAVIEAMGLSTA